MCAQKAQRARFTVAVQTGAGAGEFEIRGRRRGEESLAVAQGLVHPLFEHGARVVMMTVLSDPVDAPLERPHDAILADRGQTAFPGVKNWREHYEG